MSDRTDIPTTDEELVEMHKKARKRRKTRRIVTVVIVAAAIVIVLAIVIVMLRNRVTEAVGPSYDEVASAEVTRGSITTTVSGSGTLADEDEEDITVPSSLEITKFYVEEGESVSEGDLIATVTNASLMGAMSDTQDAIGDLDDRLRDAAGDTVSDTITSSVSGRVKAINVSPGDEVASAMYRSGALMYLSLDGYMAVDIETDSLYANDAVTVTMRNGTSYDGRVSTAAGGTATVLITDDGPVNEAQVTVETRTGTTIGTGKLYIHNPMAITGYTGRVSSIEVSENSEVTAGTTLITLTETETSANYDTLLVERGELENQLDTLISIYKEGGICSPGDGTVASIDEDLISVSSSSSYSDLYSLGDNASTSDGEVTVATISLGENMLVDISVDEADILSLSDGQTAYVTIDSIGDDAYEGTVTDISTSASGSSGVTSYAAEITIPKTDDMLSGMSASVKITIEGVDNALLIPVEALHQTSSTAYVYTEYDEDTGEFSGMKEVTAGLANSTYVEITSGLEEGDVVWYTPSEEDWYTMLMEGEDIDEFLDMDEVPGGMGGEGGMGGGGMPGGGGAGGPGGR